MTQHTPGPWMWATTGNTMRVDYSQPFGVGEAGKPNLIAGIFGDVAGGETVAEANARLIAAAPELLAACEAAEEWLSGWASADPYIGKLQAAIRKAKGAA